MKTVNEIMEIAEDYVDMCLDMNTDWVPGYEKLRTAIEELNKDAARYQFMKNCSRAFGLDINGNRSWLCQITSSNVRGATLDAAIDAAME